MTSFTSLVCIHDKVMKTGEKGVRIAYLVGKKCEKRKRLLESYTNKWIRYRENWLEKYQDFHMSVYLRAGFGTKEECINWLKDIAGQVEIRS